MAPDANAPKQTEPLANPTKYFDVGFLADPSQDYKLWLNGTRMHFPAGGPQTIRVQTREDGVSIDQIVLSSEKYETTRAGTARDDTPKLNHTGPYLVPYQQYGPAHGERAGP